VTLPRECACEILAVALEEGEVFFTMRLLERTALVAGALTTLDKSGPTAAMCRVDPRR